MRIQTLTPMEFLKGELVIPRFRCFNSNTVSETKVGEDTRHPVVAQGVCGSSAGGTGVQEGAGMSRVCRIAFRSRFYKVDKLCKLMKTSEVCG